MTSQWDTGTMFTSIRSDYRTHRIGLTTNDIIKNLPSAPLKERDDLAEEPWNHFSPYMNYRTL